MQEPRDSPGAAAGCYGLVIVVALVVAIFTALGSDAPEKNDLNIAITAER